MTLRTVEDAELLAACIATSTDVVRLQRRAETSPPTAPIWPERRAQPARERRFARKIAEIARGLT